MIAQLLQLHEEELRGQSHSSGHLRGTGGLGEAEGMVTDGSGLSFEDYELARQMQEEFDEELALEMEEEQSRGKDTVVLCILLIPEEAGHDSVL